MDHKSGKQGDDVLDYDERGGLGAMFVNVLRTWVPALLAVLLVRSLVFEAFRIPSGSMVPTMEIGDHIFVTKYSYGLRLSIPFTAKDITLVEFDLPKRGDIVVFRYPPQPELDYIKRVVALPGETIEVKDNVIFIDGVEMPRELKGHYDYTMDNCSTERSRMYREKLGDVEHWELTSAAYTRSLANFGPYKVPEDSVFVMGDNRDNSADSRAWGVVPRKLLRGNAHFIWLSYNACKGNMPLFGEFRWERFGMGLYD